MSLRKPGDIQVCHSPIGVGWGAGIMGAVKGAAIAVKDTVESGVGKALGAAPDIDSLWTILSTIPTFDATLIDPLKKLFSDLQTAENINSVEDISAYILERNANPEFNEKYGLLIQLAVEETLGSGITGFVLNQMIRFLKK